MRPTGVRWLLLTALCATLVGCDTEVADHGADVPGRAREALDCPGRPWQQGSGNYDTGPESVQDDAGQALDNWLDEERGLLPDIDIEETGRHGEEVLYSWREGESGLASFVVRDGMAGPGGDRGWGVASYAICDPSYWPPELSEASGFLVWTNADGDRVPTSLVHSEPGPEHGDWQDMTFLFLGNEGRDGEFYGRPGPDLDEFLRTTYAARTELPSDARDTGYARDGRELWIAADGGAAYLVGADGDAQRWPAPARRPIRCL